MRKHTPGPWMVDSDGDISTSCSERWLIACMPNEDENVPTMTAQAIAANKALIVMAPEMAAEIAKLRGQVLDMAERYQKSVNDAARLRERVRVLREAARSASAWMWDRIEHTEKKTGKRMEFLRSIAGKTDMALAMTSDAANAMTETQP